MRVGSLFTGIGGFDIGFQRAGFEMSYMVENDLHARKLLARQFPDTSLYEDITEVEVRKLTDEQVQQAVQLYESGLSLQQVAGYFNVSRQAIWDLLRRRITLRGQKRFGAANHFYRGGETASDRAQNIAETLIDNGVLVRPEKCERCSATSRFKNGRTGIQAHHPDYNKPMEVMWLCQKCHHDWHRTNKAIPLQEVMPMEAPDVMVGGFP